jgi:hypothetical protein
MEYHKGELYSHKSSHRYGKVKKKQFSTIRVAITYHSSHIGRTTGIPFRNITIEISCLSKLLPPNKAEIQRLVSDLLSLESLTKKVERTISLKSLTR